jgi:hypothetical protein
MHDAAADLRFEYAARLRDEIADLKSELREVTGAGAGGGAVAGGAAAGSRAGMSSTRTPVRP